MMRSLLSITFLFFLVPAFGQSKKKINEQLKSDLTFRERTYDSIQLIHSENQSQIVQLRLELMEQKRLFESLKRTENVNRAMLSKNRLLLLQQGGNADSIVRQREISALQPPVVDSKFMPTSEQMKMVFQLKSVAPENDYSGLKVKMQNAVLQERIRHYDSINNLNLETLLKETDAMDHLKDAKQEYTRVAESYPAFNAKIGEKADALAMEWYVLRKKKKEALEAEYVRELKEFEAKQKKQKGVIPFIPPIIIDDDERYFEEEKPTFVADRNQATVGSDEEVTSDGAGLSEQRAIPEPPSEPEILEIVEEPAEFTGGISAMNTYLKDNIVVPAKVKDEGVSGRVYLRFVISVNGRISNVTVVRGIPDCKECDAEALRVVKTMPAWKPGTIKGNPVNQWYTLPIKFSAN